jgi:hypothetical protein
MLASSRDVNTGCRYRHPANHSILILKSSEFGYIVRAYTDLGGYPLIYITSDGGTLCATCVKEEIRQCCTPDASGWYVTACDVHWEGEPEICDNCNCHIESAYGPVEETASETQA